MAENFTVNVEIEISVSAAKVWDALINPEIIKQYFGGVEAVSDWQEGSAISYKGEWDGTSFEDKGTIVKMIPEKLLECTYWTSFSGLPDVPENYQNVTYTLEAKGDKTVLKITQDKIRSAESRDNTETNWHNTLTTIKQILES